MRFFDRKTEEHNGVEPSYVLNGANNSAEKKPDVGEQSAKKRKIILTVVVILVVAILIVLAVIITRNFLQSDSFSLTGCFGIASSDNTGVGVEDAMSDEDKTITDRLSEIESSMFEPGYRLSIPEGFSFDLVPDWDGVTPYVEVNDNIPYFTDSQMSDTNEFKLFSDYDEYGREGTAVANVSEMLLPTSGSLNSYIFYPSGWDNTDHYELLDPVYGMLIPYELAGYYPGRYNIFTSTRYLSMEGMLPLENKVVDYVMSTGNHVLYRVSPIFVGTETVCRGVLMEAYSQEDNGEFHFCVFAYNVEPGFTINYFDGTSSRTNIDDYEEKETDRKW